MTKLGNKGLRGFLCLLCLSSLSADYALGATLSSSSEIIGSAATTLSVPPPGPTATSVPEANPPKKEKDGLETSDLISLVLGIVTLGTTFLFSTAPTLEAFMNIKEIKKLQAKAREQARGTQQGSAQDATVDLSRKVNSA